MSAWGKGGIAKSCNSLLNRVEHNDSSLIDLVILPSKTFGTTEVNRIAAAVENERNTNLKSVSASGHDIPSPALSRLGAAISSRNSTIVRLAIGDRGMGDEGVVALCSSLEATHGGSLESLDLEWKGISVDAMVAVGRCFGASQRLIHLNLSRNENIGDNGIVELCNKAMERASQECVAPFSRLEHLDLSECGIGPTGAAALVQCLKREQAKLPPVNQKRSPLLELKLNSNPIGPPGCQSLTELLCGTSSIGSLSISKCNVGDEGIELLSKETMRASCSGLHTLDVSHNNIGPTGASVFAQSLWSHGNKCWTSLGNLSLVGNNLKEEGVQALSGVLVQQIDKTVFNGNSSFHGNGTIHTLDLSQTSCGVGGATAIIQCGSLSSLRLFNNSLGSDGFRALSPLLRGGHSSIESLDLGGNNADKSAVVHLLDALAEKTQRVDSNLRVLELGGNEGGTEVEEAVRKLQLVRPDLDVARDRPRNNRGS